MKNEFIIGLRLSKNEFNIEEAKTWVDEHNFQTKTYDIRKNDFDFFNQNKRAKGFRVIELCRGVKAMVSKEVHNAATIEHLKNSLRMFQEYFGAFLNEEKTEKDQPSSSSVHVPVPDEKVSVMYRQKDCGDVGSMVSGPAKKVKPMSKDAGGLNEIDGDGDIVGPDGTPGIKLDLGSGQARERHHVGIDLYPHDDGTMVHDLNLGIPFPDESCSHVRMSGVQDLDPKGLMSEIERVLMPGGQFLYEGPNEILNAPDSMVMTGYESNEDRVEEGDVQKIEGNPQYRQIYERHAIPDAATANDAEPRTGVNQYDELPSDALLAMDAIGYNWSDATTSGRGNRELGYPSQGALVGKAVQKAFEGREVRLFKTDSHKQIVYGVVLTPDEVDAQGDWMAGDDIEKTAHAYLIQSRVVGSQHQSLSDGTQVVESYIAPMDMKCEGQYGPQDVKKGAWVLGVKVGDPEEWQKVLDGEYQAFSIGGYGQRD